MRFLRPAAITKLFDDYDEECSSVRTAAPFLSDENGKRSLHFNIAGVQSLMDLQDPIQLMLGYTRTIMKFLVLNPNPQRIGMVGLGGGSLPKYCYKHLPEAEITVAEISPEIIALRNDFHIPKDDNRFQVLCEDGADFVKRYRSFFDVLIIDGFDSSGQPHRLCTQDFYASCRTALTARGILVVNICDSGSSILIARLQRAFRASVVVVDGENSTNTIAFATASRSDLQRASPQLR